jgi:hypothetical protein
MCIGDAFYVSEQAEQIAGALVRPHPLILMHLFTYHCLINKKTATNFAIILK